MFDDSDRLPGTLYGLAEAQVRIAKELLKTAETELRQLESEGAGDEEIALARMLVISCFTLSAATA
jgi:hypothetical protein